MQQNNIQYLYFISVIRTPDSNSTSTHLMTEALLKGWKENGIDVTFFAICEFPEEKEKIEKYFSCFAKKVIVLNSLHSVSGGKFSSLCNILAATYFDGGYAKEIIKKLSNSEKPDLILAHAPSFESLPFGKALKKHFKTVPYYQYWSDPLALSGIMPEDFGFKRWLFYLAENHAYKYADQIVFGTKTLLDMNSVLYKKHTDKMRFVDVAYLPKSELAPVITRPSNEFIYAGNYYSAIRNIIPLYNAFNRLGGEYKLYIYGTSDLQLESTENVIINHRIAAKELEKIENSFANNICVLNHSCMQIPGKTFYQTDTEQNILVITDGSHKKQITDYLKIYNRFSICENNEKSIISEVIRISSLGPYTWSDEHKMKFSSKQIAYYILQK